MAGTSFAGRESRPETARRLGAAAGIITRTAHPEVSPRVQDTLTPMGQELIPLIDHMREYGVRWLSTGDAASGPMLGAANT